MSSFTSYSLPHKITSQLRLVNPYESSAIIVDLANLKDNYKQLCSLNPSSEVSACVKANAYGLRVDKVIPALSEMGCKTFFVATPNEGIEARKIAPNATIYILDGLFPNAIETYISHSLSPVISSFEQLDYWIQSDKPENLNAALHIDTGINRLGLHLNELAQLKEQYKNI